jgi:hypothetical protein
MRPTEAGSCISCPWRYMVPPVARRPRCRLCTKELKRHEQREGFCDSCLRATQTYAFPFAK